MYRLAGCKYAPNCFMPYVWMSGIEFDKIKPGFSAFNGRYSDGMLATPAAIGDDKKVCKIIHLRGAHFPYYINENGEDQEETNNNDVGTALGITKIVLKYIEQLKECGAYDNTSIIIRGDHGFYTSGVLSNPVFLTKAKGAHGDMNINYNPVSQANYTASFMELLGDENAERFGVPASKCNENNNGERFLSVLFI